MTLELQSAGAALAPWLQAVTFEMLLERLRVELEDWLVFTDLLGLITSAIAALVIGILVYAGLALLRRGARRRIESLKAAAQKDLREGCAALSALADMISATSSLFMAVTAVVAGSYALTLGPVARGALSSIFIIAFVLQATIWASVALRASLDFYVNRHADRRSVRGGASIIGLIGRGALWSIALLLILDNLGFNVTALVAGLGIGGIAIGLAAQSILSDLFASLSIIFDKPFEVDDFVISGDYMGTVERIGLKTTRLRSLSGEQVVISNADLLASRIRNYKRMAERRVVFTLGVVYGTPHQKLAAIPGMIRAIIEAQPLTRFDRCHFARYGDFALVFEVAYYVLSPDFKAHMDILQTINLAIYQRFAEEDIRFAYPTQSIHVASMPAAGTPFAIAQR